ncbi:nucleocapsid protein N [Hedgehog arterivirus]|nr:nucleocapsid protein N [Hedgehog arterivirus]
MAGRKNQRKSSNRPKSTPSVQNLLTRILAGQQQERSNKKQHPRKAATAHAPFPLADASDARRLIAPNSFGAVKSAIVTALMQGAGTLTVAEGGTVSFNVEVFVPPRFVKSAMPQTS